MPLEYSPHNASSSEASIEDVAESFYEVFRRLLYSLLGESVGEAVLTLVKKSIQQDITKAFWENPRRVYDELFKIFGEGTKVLISIIVSRINQECGLDIKPEKLITLMCSGDQGNVNEIHSIMMLIAKSYKKS